MSDTDEGRFNALHQANATALLHYFQRRVVVREDAADLLAETYLVAWRRIRAVPADDGDARAWMFGVAHGVLANHRRGIRRRLSLAERIRDEITRQPTAAPASPLQGDVDAALALLSADDRELLLLTSWDGLSPQQAASVLGIGAGAARTRLHRARSRLRDSLALTQCRTFLEVVRQNG